MVQLVTKKNQELRRIQINGKQTQKSERIHLESFEMRNKLKRGKNNSDKNTENTE